MIDSYHMIEPLPLDFDWENEAATTLEAPDATPLGEDSELVKIWLDGGSDARTWSLNHHWPARCFALADRAGYKAHDVVGFSLVLEGAVQIVCLCTLHVAMRAKGGHGQPGVRAWMRGSCAAPWSAPSAQPHLWWPRRSPRSAESFTIHSRLNQEPSLGPEAALRRGLRALRGR